MDDFERDLHSELDRLAENTEPSDALIDRTRARAGQIRRRRNALTASGVAACALVIALVVAAVAGAGTHGSKVQVANPGGIELPATSTSTTTTVPVTTTTVAIPPGPPATGGHPRSSSTVPASPTTTMPCPSPPPEYPATTGTYTQLPNGDIRVEFYFPFGPARESHYETFDDGTNGEFVATNVYSPAEFGPHWLDAWTVVGTGIRSCTDRLTFDVNPSLVPTTVPDTTPTTDTTIPSDSTTIPETTTTGGP